MVKVKEQIHKPQINEIYPRCRECNVQIHLTAVDLDEHEIKVFHTKCYTKFLEEFKEYGIRIGMRVHGTRSTK